MNNTAEDVLLSDLASELPGRPTYRTLLRWAKTGALSRRGKRVKLKTVKLPRGEGSSRDKYDDFVSRLED